MKITRSQLVEGKRYYMDGSYKETGVFVCRDIETHSIFFDCGKNTQYNTSNQAPFEGLVGFWDDNEAQGFEEVDSTKQSIN